jgi:hypothetical protein
MCSAAIGIVIEFILDRAKAYPPVPFSFANSSNLIVAILEQAS